MRAQSVSCMRCGHPLPLGAETRIRCPACGRAQRVDRALRQELEGHQRRLEELSQRSVEARSRQGLARESTSGRVHAAIVGVPILVSLVAMVAGLFWPPATGWTCFGGALLYLPWLVVVMRRASARLRSDTTPRPLQAAQEVRCPTCGAPARAGTLQGMPCAHCGAPLLSPQEGRTERLVQEEVLVESEQAVARSLERQLRARTERHRREDLAPWLAFVLCFGALPLVGPPAALLGWRAGNYGLQEASLVMGACLVVAALLSIYPLLRWRRARALQEALDQARAQGLDAGSEATALVDWLDAHWSSSAPAEPDTLFRQGARWVWVSGPGWVLVLNLDRVNRTHPCQRAAWIGESASRAGARGAHRGWARGRGGRTRSVKRSGISTKVTSSGGVTWWRSRERTRLAARAPATWALERTHPSRSKDGRRKGTRSPAEGSDVACSPRWYGLGQRGGLVVRARCATCLEPRVPLSIAPQVSEELVLSCDMAL